MTVKLSIDSVSHPISRKDTASMDANRGNLGEMGDSWRLLICKVVAVAQTYPYMSIDPEKQKQQWHRTAEATAKDRFNSRSVLSGTHKGGHSILYRCGLLLIKNNAEIYESRIQNDMIIDRK